LIRGFDLATRAFTLNAIRREFGPRREKVVGQCVRYLRMCEHRTAVLAAQAPASHRDSKSL
jgi:hypothetical protein